MKEWFCREVLPLEGSLTRYIRRNWRNAGEIADLRQDIYASVLGAARSGLPQYSKGFLFAVARNHLIDCARRARIVSFELVADMEQVQNGMEIFDADRQLSARDELRRAQAGLEQLPPRCREVVRLRKIEGLSTREAAERMGTGVDNIERQMTIGMRALTDFMLGGSGKVRRGPAALGMRRGRPS